MQGNEGRLDLWPCWQLGMPGWHWRSLGMAGARLERVTVWVTASGTAGMTTRIQGLAAFTRAESAAGSWDQRLGWAGRSWEAWLGSFLGVPLCRRGSESPHPAWESFGSPHFDGSSRGRALGWASEGPAGFPVGARPPLGTNLWGWGPQTPRAQAGAGRG